MQTSTFRSFPDGAYADTYHNGAGQVTQVTISDAQGRTTSQRTIDPNGTQSYHLHNADGTQTQFTLGKNGQVVKPVSVTQEN